MKANYKNPADFRVSACTITKNEEKVLARSIESYKNAVDELIVVDTGSTDKTVEIAKALGAKVYHFEWCNDFSAARNFALEKATGDWILFLDADEYFADKTAENLKPVLLEANLQGKNAIGCRIEHIDVDTNTWIGDGFTVRAFRSDARYFYPIHEEIHIEKGIDLLSVDKTYFYIKHTGYSSKLIKRKCERNLALLLEQVESTDDEQRLLINYSYISDAYYGIDDYDKAREYAQMYIDQSEGKKIALVGCEGKPYLNIIHGLEKQYADSEVIGRYVKAFSEKYPDSPEAVFADARNAFRSHLFGRAVKLYAEALAMSEKGGGTYEDTVSVYRAQNYIWCGMCEEGLLHKTAALDWYFKAFQQANNYQAAVFNILRVLRDMPQNELDKLIDSFYYGFDAGHKQSILTGLMCNYMVPQIIRCYAIYRTETGQEALNSTITAFILAGQGKFAEAAEFFHYSYTVVSSTKEDSMRCLLCAVLSDDPKMIEKARAICSPVYAFALGLADKPETIPPDELFDIAAIYAEAFRLGQTDFTAAKIKAAAGLLDDKQMIRMAEFLAEAFAFEPALAVLRQTSILAESVFLQGYCLYRMYRFNEAEALMALAKQMGYCKQDFDEVTGAITAYREKEENASTLQEEQKEQFKREIEQKLAAGDTAGAGADIDRYMQLARPDADLFALRAVLFYYTGEYKRAAVAAECGLRIDERNVDLLYNGGCIYEKLGDRQRAKVLYATALVDCADDALSGEIRQLLAAVESA